MINLHKKEVKMRNKNKAKSTEEIALQECTKMQIKNIKPSICNA
jgi:hypothetical protein